MVNFSRSELLELFFQEVQSYIPEMQEGLSAVIKSKNMQAAGELHRLFHNVKGAAAQVQLSHLSRGARVVEEYLAAIVENGAPIIDDGVDSIKKTIEILDVFVESESSDSAVEKKFCEAVEGMCWPLQEDQIDESGDETLETIRSLLPLLNELAACLGSDATHRQQNSAVYLKLSSAFQTLSDLTESNGMEGAGLLFKDFYSLLCSLSEGGNPQQDDVVGLIQDFLGFVEVAFSEHHLDRFASLDKIHTQLKQVKLLLFSPEKQKKDGGAKALDSISDDLFGDAGNTDTSISFLDELSEVDLPEDEDLSLVNLSQDENSDLLDFFSDEQDGTEVNDFLAEEDTEELPLNSIHPNPIDSDQDVLAAIFKEECEEHFITINASLNHLEKLVAHDSSDREKIIDPLREIRRAVHTLKGAASLTGVDVLAGAAHGLEDLLDWLYDHDVAIEGEEIQLISDSVGTLESLVGTTDPHKAQILIDHIQKYLSWKKQTGEEQEEVVVTEDSISLLAEAEQGPQELSVLPEDHGTLRVKLDDLDELLSIEGELVVARGAIENLVEDFSATLIDLENVKENLRKKSQELETGFEVQALYDGKSSKSPGIAPFMFSDRQDTQDLSEFDPIELDRYSELNLIIRSLNEISVDVNSIHSTLQSLTSSIGGQVSRQQLTMRQMQDKLMRIRMTPLSSISRVLYGAVRSAATKLGKNIDLNVVGEDVYMDRFVWAKVTDPLVHILRNSVDHGIESLEDRRLAGKNERGRITLHAEQRSRYVVLHISDDGRGIDLERLRKKLSVLKIVNNPDMLSDSELLDYIFYPSVSTKDRVSEVSGRGVGLDVVKNNIQDLRGSIHIDNTPGQGVRFEIHIPFSLSVNRAILVNVAGSPFAVPLQDIEEIKQFKFEDLKDENGQLSLRIKDEYVTFASLASYLQIDEPPDFKAGGSVIMFSATTKSGEVSKQRVLSVTEIIEQREIIVKSLGSHLTHVPGISGVTVSGAGDLIPILNLRELVNTAPQARQKVSTTTTVNSRTEPLKVLIVDDSISVRYSIARLIESQGWTQKQAVDGFEALGQLETYTPDVIILDIEMPKMNGYEFKANINNRDIFKDIPVVMLTSRASEKHRQKAKDLGVAYYLTKPYEEDSFVQLLERIQAERN